MRFSLRTLLSVTLLAALAMSFLFQRNNLRKMHVELESLRAEEVVLAEDAKTVERLLELGEEAIREVAFPSDTFRAVEAKWKEVQENRNATTAVDQYGK